MTEPHREQIRCFLISPREDDELASTVYRAISGVGWQPVTLSQLAVLGDSLLDSLRRALSAVDIVVGMLSDRLEPNVLVEAGVAVGVGKPLLIVATEKAKVPPDLLHALLVRADPSNRDAIEFALKTFAGAPYPLSGPGSTTRRTQPIGDLATTLLLRVQDIESRTPASTVDLEAIVRTAIDASGATVAAGGPAARYDLGVWSPDLDAIRANPVVVEVRKSASISALRQLESVVRTGFVASLGLLVYLKHNPNARTARSPNVLSISVSELLSQMATDGFSEVIRRLRNKAAHGL